MNPKQCLIDAEQSLHTAISLIVRAAGEVGAFPPPDVIGPFFTQCHARLSPTIPDGAAIMRASLNGEDVCVTAGDARKLLAAMDAVELERPAATKQSPTQPAKLSRDDLGRIASKVFCECGGVSTYWEDCTEPYKKNWRMIGEAVAAAVRSSEPPAVGVPLEVVAPIVKWADDYLRTHGQIADDYAVYSSAGRKEITAGQLRAFVAAYNAARRGEQLKSVAKGKRRVLSESTAEAMLRDERARAESAEAEVERLRAAMDAMRPLIVRASKHREACRSHHATYATTANGHELTEAHIDAAIEAFEAIAGGGG